ncbi:AraC family transcriptional regulator [uncultured Algibacter sp.]|uniref:helix-turn-helix domain-containing protein n=1 Tax=uncultured Algibacter sp. TaxID=298659 RepID=UPI003216D2F5
MTNYNFLDIISILSLFIGILFSVFLFTSKTKNKLSNRLFGVFLLLSAIDNIFLSKLIGQTSYNTSAIVALLVFLHLPIFYLYIVSVCYSGFKLKTKHILHTIPFFIVNLLLLTNFYGVNPESSIILLSNLSEDFKNSFVHVFIHIQVVCYLVAVFIVLIRAKKIYLENYANSSMAFYTWLFQLTIAISVLHVFAIFKNIYKFSDYETFYYWTRVALQLIELTIFCWYVLKALNAPNLFKSVDSKLKLTSNLISENNTPITEAPKINDEVQALKNYMINEEPYLDSSLTIQGLANQMKLHTKDVSILINHTIGKHFFDFINEYRIQKATQILEDSTQNQLTVLEILYHVGFNSKSSFNTAFKKYTGETPTAYRKLKITG